MMSKFQVATLKNWFSYINYLQKSKNELPRSMNSGLREDVEFKGTVVTFPKKNS